MTTITLKDATKLNAFKQVDASTLSELCSNSQEVKLLPSSANYDWYASYDDVKDLVCNGEVITLGRARYANIKYYKGDFLSSNNVLIQSKDENMIRTKFLYYFLLKTKKDYYVEGTTYPKFDQSNFDSKQMPLLDINKQDEIINQLGYLFKCIENKQNELNHLDELIKSRFIGLFGHQALNEKKLPYLTIDDVADIYLGITHTPKYVDNGVIFISAKNTSGDFLDLSDVKYISKEEFQTAPKGSKPQKDDILFSRVGSNLGHPVILEDNMEICTFVSLGFLRSKGNVTSNYLKHWMRDDFFAEQVKEHVQGGGQPNLNTGWLKKFKIIVPSKEDQIKFDMFCALIDKSKFVNYSRYFL